MMTGIVAARHISLNVRLIGDNAQETEVDFILDTGFEGYLTLPTTIVAALALPYKYPIPTRLADGKRYMMQAYEARIRWDDQERLVEVIATGNEPLLGTSLLQGFDVAIRFVDGGSVTIRSATV